MVGVVVELATAPATARDEDTLHAMQNAAKQKEEKDKKEHTKEPSPSKWDKHSKKHASRNPDKLRGGDDWQPKKGAGGGRSPGSWRDKEDN